MSTPSQSMIDTIVKQHPSDSLHDNVVPFIRRSTEFGVVVNFMATMEFKHKSETATQQEARRIRSHLLNDEKVVVLNLHLESGVGLFRSSVPNIDDRCQVIHECIACKTQIGIYAVATAQVEYVLIVIVPSDVRQAYRGFTNLVRNDYLDWIFIPGTNDYDRTLARMPR
jgi:hypothetical protein